MKKDFAYRQKFSKKLKLDIGKKSQKISRRGGGWGCNFPGGNFPGVQFSVGQLSGGNFPGSNFPGTLSNIT